MKYDRVPKLISGRKCINELPLGSHLPNDAAPYAVRDSVSQALVGFVVDVMIPRKPHGTQLLHGADPGTTFKGRVVRRVVPLPFTAGQIDMIQLGGNEDVKYDHISTAVVRDDCHV